MAIERPKIETVGFGFEPSGGAYHFVVTIPPSEEGTVTVAEHFAYGESVESAADRARFSDSPNQIGIRHPRVKVEIALFRWQRIADEVRTDFNRRLLGRGAKKSTWKPGENRLAPHLGRELVLLLWAIEQANPADIPNAVANWLGLAAEERWWLYTTINAATGHVSEGRGRGWRKAIQIAFTENPVTNPTYFDRSARSSSGGSIAEGSSSNQYRRNGKRIKSKPPADEELQPILLEFDDEKNER